MGLLEDIMGKMDTLIAELQANTAARTAEGGGTATADKPKATRGKAAAKTEGAGPTATKEEVDALITEKKEKHLPAIKTWLADNTPDGKLASLLALPAKYDEAVAFLNGLADEPVADDDDL